MGGKRNGPWKVKYLVYPLCHYGYGRVCITYLGEVELLCIIHVVNGHLAVGEKVVALDLPRQQKVIFRGIEKTRLIPTLPQYSQISLFRVRPSGKGRVMVDGSLRSSCEPPASSW